MQGHTAIALRGAGKEGMRKLASNSSGVRTRPFASPNTSRNGWGKVLLEQALMGRRVGSDEDLVHLFQLGGWWSTKTDSQTSGVGY